ncbi:MULTISPECIES: hypothetical protein [Ramlibacter]|uniref:Uncharacterized protein n=1 Tax=Ramlibacter aquaticus TaxID=2780094 RepID=A0ABR9SCM3_9BURK|nr:MULTISPECIES: hypothetical protein [Ramlibacter]MBE7940105.1 hypothetical protein [Ramlibacter aquaticus]
MLEAEFAAAVRRRRAQPSYWLQLHFGFLCEERRRETRRVQTEWQVGRQPGDWIWASLEGAVRFMGALEQGHLLVLRRGSTFALANELRSGWRAQGVVVGQYRPHGEAARLGDATKQGQGEA